VTWTQKLFFAFASVCAGWAAGMVYYWLVAITLGVAAAGEASAFAVYTGIFALIAYLLLFVPLVLFVPASSSLFSFKQLPFVGAIAASLVLLVLFEPGFLVAGFWLFVPHALVISTVTAAGYLVLKKRATQP